MTLEEELRRLDSTPLTADEPAVGQLVRMTATAPGSASTVLQRIRDVMRVLLEHSGGAWPSEEEWRVILPHHFVRAAAAPRSHEEDELWLERWRALPALDQAAAAEAAPWSLTDWLYWMEPASREWHWWRADHDGSTSLWIDVQVDGWPTALGSLHWLVRASGGRPEASSE